MTARREARRRSDKARSDVPACLRVGKLTDVWSDSGTDMVQAMRRYGTVRRWWLATADVDEAMTAEVSKGGAPWSLDHLGYVGQAERVGRPVEDIADDRLRRAGVRRVDLPKVRKEALTLFKRATAEAGG